MRNNANLKLGNWKQCSKFQVCMSWSCGITVTTALLKVTWISVYWHLFYPCRSFSHSPSTGIRKKELWVVNMLIEDQLDKHLQSRNVGVSKQWNAYRTPMNITFSRNIELHFILANLEKCIFDDLSCHSKWKTSSCLITNLVTDIVKCTAVQNSHWFKRKNTKNYLCFSHF